MDAARYTTSASATGSHNKVAERDGRKPTTSNEEVLRGEHYGVYPCDALPYQFVPSATNVKMSILPAVAVTVGVPPLFHFTLVNVAVPLPVVAACFRSKMNDFPAVAVGIVNVQAVEAVSVAVSTVPAAMLSVDVVVTVPTAVTVSV